MLCAVGVVGLWQLMYMTLSIVLASVLLALIIGLPTGILLSASRTAPCASPGPSRDDADHAVFVYLIPALLLFGLGSASAVIATVIYAVVPVIRLTSLGIRQVDESVAGASRSFGSTRMQTLTKYRSPSHADHYGWC